MPDPDGYDDPNLEESQQQDSHDIRQLRAKAKKADEIAAENADLKRQLAFNASGVDLTTPVGKLFAKAYDGSPTAEAVRASAVEYGVIAPPEPVVGEQERADLQTIAALGTSNESVTGAPSNTIKPEDAAGWSMEAALRFARSHPTEWEALKRGEDVLRP